MPPPVSFVAIGLFVTTIGFSIGLVADFFRDVAQGRLALVQAKLTARQCSPGSVCEKWPALPLASPPVRSMQAAGSSSPALNWATHWRRRRSW
jgi:hypothetical protein